MKSTNAKNYSYLGEANPVKILEADPHRRTYITFYAVSGDCQIVVGDNTFADNAITLPEGTMWEPRITLTDEVWFKGSGSRLTVLY